MLIQETRMLTCSCMYTVSIITLFFWFAGEIGDSECECECFITPDECSQKALSMDEVKRHAECVWDFCRHTENILFILQERKNIQRSFPFSINRFLISSQSIQQIRAVQIVLFTLC